MPLRCGLVDSLPEEIHAESLFLIFSSRVGHLMWGYPATYSIRIFRDVEILNVKFKFGLNNANG